VSVLKPTLWTLCAFAVMAVVGVFYLKVAERGIDAASSTKDTPGSFGELMRVGDIDFTVLGISRFSTSQKNTFSKPNFQVQFEATNARGADGRTHDFSQLSVKVVDDAGVVHDAVACPQCPGQVTGLPTKIVKGGTLEGTYYFQLPDKAVPATVLYQPLFSRQTAKIDVRGAVR
jgi:hypothetical protein